MPHRACCIAGRAASIEFITDTTQATKAARAELADAGVAKHTIDSLYPTALQQMVGKIDAKGGKGYIANRDEIIEIISGLSALVSGNVTVFDYAAGNPNDPEKAEKIYVELKLGFTLSRKEL